MGPMTTRHDRFQDTYVQAVPELAIASARQPMASPEVLLLNEPLADDLGLDPAWLRTPDGVAQLTGDVEPPAHALAYAGHQFGRFSPQLGDGRALLLGELLTTDGRRVDLHAKGTGRTVFARGGDGNAELGPMLREYLFAEAMHALGVPTTRALVVLTTGATIRGGTTGAVVVRTAASHVRVGTFEFAARFDPDVLRRLADHVIDRHHPAAREHERPALGLLEAVVDAQAALVASWMSLGFIHGVLNTDNVLVAAETIDYGPCAFMDRHDPTTVFSSIDRGGRYAYGNQPAITRWNLTRFAETLLPLIDPDPDVAVPLATEVLQGFGHVHTDHWLAVMQHKLGLPTVDAERCGALVDVLASHRIDHTGAFRALAAWLRGDDDAFDGLAEDPTDLTAWAKSWRDDVLVDGRSTTTVADAMDAVNPVHVPRNHLVDDALRRAEEGDLGPFRELLAAVTDPFTGDGHDRRFAEPAPDDFTEDFQTFCGT